MGMGRNRAVVTLAAVGALALVPAPAEASPATHAARVMRQCLRAHDWTVGHNGATGVTAHAPGKPESSWQAGFGNWGDRPFLGIVVSWGLDKGDRRDLRRCKARALP